MSDSGTDSSLAAPMTESSAELNVALLAEAAGANAAAQGARDQKAAPPAFLDPAVSRAKFEREVANYRAQEAEYLKRGWILISATYPNVIVLYAAAHIAPSPVLAGVVVNFTNYDFWPLSVRFVHPFTLAPLMAHEAIPLFKKLVTPDGQTSLQPLVMKQDDNIPFICLQGIREYHFHPFHSNDPWLAHRGTGIGSLYHILDTIYRHGVLALQMSIQVVSAAVTLAPDSSRYPE